MSWICARCETVNPDTNHVCEVCDTEKPHPVKGISHYAPLPSVAVDGKPEHKSSKSWIAGIIMSTCLCLAVVVFLITSISNQNVSATQTTSSQNVTATAWTMPFFSESFDSASSWEWYDGNGVGFIVEYGKIKGEVTGQTTAWTLAGQSFGNVKIDVDIEKISGTDNNQMGVLCNAVDTRHFYAFVVGSDQTYIVWRQDGDNGIKLVDWAASSIIGEGKERNYLTAICSDGNLMLLVNGVELVSVYDATYLQGDVGIIVGSFEENVPVSAYFDNFNVSNP
jgi:hypothetical protein